MREEEQCLLITKASFDWLKPIEDGGALFSMEGCMCNLLVFEIQAFAPREDDEGTPWRSPSKGEGI